MATLLIKCPSTGKLVGTGMDFPKDSFASATLTNNKTRCSACGQIHTWSKKDVVSETWAKPS